MKALILLRWVVMKWAGEPWKWALFTILVGLWPAMEVLAPFGANPAHGAARDLIYEVAFVAGGVGTACTLDALEVLPTCAYSLGLRPGWPTEWAALVAGGLACQVAALGLPMAAMRDGVLWQNIDLAGHVSLSSACLASAGLFLLRVPMPAGLRPFALLALAWIFPALAPSSVVPSLFSAGPRLLLDDFSTRSLALGRIASIFALLLGAHLMDAQRQQRP